MPIIRQLPTSIINKIAAGEVIERPASVVKEMLENSVDAGATRIELVVEKGGVDLIRISDNGCGIAEEQLLLAVAPHATSKLVTADDLFEVQSLGFRGEALASIAEISHLVIRSRTAEMESGAELIIRGGEQEGPRPCAASLGTTFEVRHLFFNTPVRRKFLKSPQTEMGHVSEAFTRIALAYPQVHMVLESGGRKLYDLPPSERWSERIRIFFGDEVGDALIPIESQQGEIRLRGYVADPSVSRSHNRMQYLFLNGRHIRDRSLQHALSEAYRGLLMVGRFPVCFLRLEIPSSEVDVNVHPTKSEVRFADSGRIYSQLLHALRHKFLTTDMTARVGRPTSGGEGDEGGGALLESRGEGSQGSVGMAEAAGSGGWSPAGGSGRESWGGEGGSTASRGSFVPSAVRLPGLEERPAPFRPFPDGSGVGGSLVNRMGAVGSERARVVEEVSARTEGEVHRDRPSVGFPVGALEGERSTRVDGPAEGTMAGGRCHLGFQIHQRYLVTEDEQGMVVVDQHALHERILYEQIREKVLSEKLESQRLLVPETVTLSPAEAAAALESKEVLSKLGIEVEPFGGDTILITAYPAILSKISPAELLRQALEPLMEGGKQPEARDILDSLLHMFSCKAAIKAGDRLTADEIEALLEQRHLFADTHHCPHGRPTALFFSREQLDKMFKRI